MCEKVIKTETRQLTPSYSFAIFSLCNMQEIVGDESEKISIGNLASIIKKVRLNFMFIGML